MVIFRSIVGGRSANKESAIHDVVDKGGAARKER